VSISRVKNTTPGRKTLVTEIIAVCGPVEPALGVTASAGGLD